MISIDNRDSRPLYEQVFDAFKTLITAGVLSRDEKLPSVRELATELAINPNTIQRAYRELENQGYTYSVVGKGSFVAEAAEVQKARKEELFDQLKDVVKELLMLGASEEEIVSMVKGGVA